ncbi:MAG: hypothetical protein K9J79_07595 [Desulfobacteraceae bacterium]|nr:hypothetical protein [Desulfobacteraceae bacterium]
MCEVFSKKTWIAGVLVFIFSLFLSGCFGTAVMHDAPPMEKRQGTAPAAAMLPFENTNDREVAEFVTQKVKTCLEKRNVLDFADQSRVDRVVEASGYDMGSIFGLNEDQYKSLADPLGVDYTIHGTITVKKTLTFSGWRKDVDVYLYLNDGKTGEKLDSWRSMTTFTWAKKEEALDAQTMAESAANHICSKMLNRQY